VADDSSALGCLKRESVKVIYNPVPLPTREGALENDVQKLWNGRSGWRLITVGTLKTQKNHALLIRAFRRLLESVEATLLILGGGDMFEATAEVARAEGVADRVIMPGATSNPAPYYRSADLFVLSSDWEGLPTVLIEALGFGLPVVSTDCCSGPAEILENGRYGQLVSVGDANALAVAMAEALGAEHDRDALRRRAADFSPERAADQYLSLLCP
jgi:glycosyltransferase involved in cell wall biosynthesis